MDAATKRLLVASAVGLALNLVALMALGWTFLDSGLSTAMLVVNAGLLVWFAYAWWSESSAERAMERYKREGP